MRLMLNGIHSRTKRTRSICSVGFDLDRHAHLARAVGRRLELRLDDLGASDRDCAGANNLLVHLGVGDGLVGGNQADAIRPSEGRHGTDTGGLNGALVLRTSGRGARFNDAGPCNLTGLGGEQ